MNALSDMNHVVGTLQRVLRSDPDLQDKEIQQLIRTLENDATIEKLALRKLLRRVENHWNHATYNVSLDEFHELQKKKNVEENIAHHLRGDISCIHITARGLAQELRERRLTQASVDQLSGQVDQLNINDEFLRKYLEELKHLPYDKRWQKNVRKAACRMALMYWTITAQGIEHVPRNGPCVLFCRHYHGLIDVPAIMHVVDRPTFFEASIEHFVTLPGQGKLSSKMGAHPVWQTRHHREFSERQMRKFKEYPGSNEESYENLRTHLKHGECVLSFPEGYSVRMPGRKTRPWKFAKRIKHGSLNMVHQVQKEHGIRVPIVPIGMHYEGRHVFVNIGKARTMELHDKEHVRLTAAGELFQEVIQLSEAVEPK